MYMANCLIAIAGALGGHPCCQGRIRQLHLEADRHVAELVQAEATARLSQWGLAEIVDRIRYASLLSGAPGCLFCIPVHPTSRLCERESVQYFHPEGSCV